MLDGAVSAGFIGVRVMRKLVLDFSGPETGTEQRFWQAAVLCVCAFVRVCGMRVSIESSEPARPFDDSLAHGQGKSI